MNSSAYYLNEIRQGRSLALSDQLRLIFLLSLPAVMSHLAMTVMQMCDSAMAGRLGAERAASIGLVISTTWLFSGLVRGVVVGFTVSCAHLIGAQRNEQAKEVCRQGFVMTIIVSLILAAVGMIISPLLPIWLGGESAILADASGYFFIYALFLPLQMVDELAAGMLEAAGNTKLPGFSQLGMCVLDVAFNWIFIFGLRLGVIGAALGTGAAVALTALFISYCLLRRDPFLGGFASWKLEKNVVRRAFGLGIPVSLEQLANGTGYVCFTRIVATLGSLSVAAHSFAVTVEGLCYQPGFGIAAAATAIIGQAKGAGHQRLTVQLSRSIEWFGIAVMSLSGVLLWFLAPAMMGLLSPEAEVVSLGANVLKLEAFAEPMYGASIVAAGILRGLGDTKWSTAISLFSNWCIRIPLAMYMVRFGLSGVWMAVVIELNIRGLLFLARLYRTKK